MFFIWEFLKNGSYLFGIYFYFYNLLVGLFAFCYYKLQQEIFILIPSYGDEDDWQVYYKRYLWIWALGACFITIQMFVILMN